MYTEQLKIRCSKCKVYSEAWGKYLSHQVEHRQVTNGTGLGVRRRECPRKNATNVANALWKPLAIRQKVKPGKQVMVLLKVLSMEYAIVYDQVSAFHRTFLKGELHIVL